MKPTNVNLLSIAIIGLCLSLWGGATSAIGRDFDASRAKQIAKRKTTESQVLALLGWPSRSYAVNSTGTGWTYSFQTPKGAPKAYRKSLTILFDKQKVVVNYWLRQEPIPGQEPQGYNRNAARVAYDGSTQYLGQQRPVKPAPPKKTPPPVAKQAVQSNGRNALPKTNAANAKYAGAAPVKAPVIKKTPPPPAKQAVQNNGRNAWPKTNAANAKYAGAAPVKTPVAKKTPPPLAKQGAQANARNAAPPKNVGNAKYAAASPVKATTPVKQTPPPVAKPATQPTVQSQAQSASPATSGGSAQTLPAGPVNATVTNESASPLMLKVERNGSTVAQVKVMGAGSKNVLLPRGEYGMKLKLNGRCYRAPGFSIAANSASVKLIWTESNMASLRPISEAEFAR